ncbi:MAG: hypothetical protein M3O36_07190, partial [Myxococcota bacterium]|nr:hypothetical protein [Myxococcota bacterium]
LAGPIAPAPPAIRRAVEPPLARGEVEAMIRAAVDEAMAPLRPLLDVERRLAELERRASASLAERRPPMVRAAASTTYGPAARAPAVDVPIHVETGLAGAADLGPFDGRRRRRRLVVGLALALFVLFGGLFLLLAASYANTHP